MAGHSSVIVSQIKTEDGSDVSSESPGIYNNTSNSGLSTGQNSNHRIMGPVVDSTISHCQSSKSVALELYAGEMADRTPSPPLSPESHQQVMFCSSTMPGDGIGVMVVSNSDGKSGDPPKRLCLVCGDVASGFHYGVASCEACKAFFKRTIQGNIEYTCPCENNCEINKRRRKACQACRYQKCLRMGMLKEGVRLDRVRGGRQKYRRCQDSPYQVPALTYKKPSLEENKLIAALISCEPEPLHLQTSSALADPQYRTISMLSDLVDRELVATIGWAKQIPGFTDLTLNDQMRLLQTTWTEILSLALAYRSYQLANQASKLMYTPDFAMDEQQAAECQASELYSCCMRLVKRLDCINIAKEEYLALKALLLTNADIQLEDSASVCKLRDVILTGLQEFVSVFRTSNCIQHLNQLLLCLPLIRQLDSQVRLFWNNVRREGKVQMKKLFVEMLECDVPF